MIFGLERSGNNIYDRIVLQLIEELHVFGHHCMVVQSSGIKSVLELYQIYARCDWVIVSNNGCLMSQKIGDFFLFEQIPAKVIFLHHDSLSHSSNDLIEITEKVSALIRIKDRSIHFTIEKGDQIALNDLGIVCHLISHMNTLGKPYLENKMENALSRRVSFIGHAIPMINAMLTFGQDDLFIYKESRARMHNFQHKLRDEFLVKTGMVGVPMTESSLSARIQYLQFINYYTLFVRGSVLQQLTNCQIDLYGGDPAWMHGEGSTRDFEMPHITNRMPVFEKNEVANIFRSSAININITSLQFDSAMINRVIDCVASGGFMLTDWKEQLFELTSCAQEVCFSTADELAYKIDYFLSPNNKKIKEDIVAQMSDDFSKKCSANQTVACILENLS